MFARSLRVASRLAAGVTAGSVAASFCEQPLEDPKIHLRYFDARGVAETTRVLLALGAQDYTEDRYTFSMEGGKPQFGPEFTAARASGELRANMDRAPVLVVNGTEIGQSKAIERFVARQLGMMGRNELEAAKIDAFTEHIRDLKEKYQVAKRTDEAALNAYFGEKLPEMLQKLEADCGNGAGVIGCSISLADVCLWQFFEEYFTDKEPATAALQKFPQLKEAVMLVRTDRNVTRYTEERRDTPL